MPETAAAQALWLRKVAHFLRAVGRQAVHGVLVLHAVLRDPAVPGTVKAAVSTALVYFVTPLDLIPDVVPGGYADDIAILSAVLALVKRNAAPEVVERAERAAEALFDIFIQGDR